MSPGFVLGGCALLAVHADVTPGRWSGWDAAWTLTVQGGADCRALTVALPAGATLGEVSGRVRRADAPNHRVDAARAVHLGRDGRGGTVHDVVLAGLGPADLATVTLHVHHKGWAPWAWTPPDGMPATLRLPRKVTAVPVAQVDLTKRRAWASGPGARVDVVHPGAVPDDDPAAVARTMSVPDAVAAVHALAFIPPGLLADRGPRGDVALRAGQADDLGVAATLRALTDGAVEIARWSARADQPPLPGADHVPVWHDGDAWRVLRHPGHALSAGFLHGPGETPIPVPDTAGLGPPARPWTAHGTVAVRLAGPTLDRAWRTGAIVAHALHVRFDEGDGPRLARVPLPARGVDPGTITASCSGDGGAAAIHGTEVVLAPGPGGSCTIRGAGRTDVPWGDAWLPGMTPAAVDVAWLRPDGRTVAGVGRPAPGGWWVESVGTHPLLPDRRGPAGWLEQQLREASMPEPGLPLSIRRQDGWEAVTDLVAAARTGLEIVPLPGVAPWDPRPLHAARRSGVVTPSELAWLTALHLRQARREADVFFALRHGDPDVRAPVGPVHPLVRVRTEGGEAWIDPACETCPPLQAPDGVRVLPAVGTGGVVLDSLTPQE